MNETQKSSIAFLIFSKLFNRLAFYLMITNLTSYLMNSLNMAHEMAGGYYSIFYGTITFITFFSGLLGDLKNRAKVVTTGFIILTIGYIALVFLPHMQGAVMVALIILALGLGLVGPNMTVFLGNTYNEKGTEIFGLPGFILFSMVINLVVFIAPPLSNYLKHLLGYSSIFFVAVAFALTSLLLFLKFKANYSQLDLHIENNTKQPDVTYININTTLLVSTLFIYALIGFVLFQKGMIFKYSLGEFVNQGFALEQTLTDAGKYISIILAGMFAIVAIRMKHLTWKGILNIILTGTVICTIAWVMIAANKPLSELMGKKSIFINAFVMILIAETLISPTVSYIVYRTSPERYKGLFQGLLYAVAAISLSSLAIGVSLYKNASPSIAFILFIAVLATSLVLIIVLKSAVRKKVISDEIKTI